MSTNLNARILELLNDGLSDAEIVRVIRRESSPDMSFAHIKRMIHAVLDSESSSDSGSDSGSSHISSVITVEEVNTSKVREVRQAILYFDHNNDSTDVDRLTITPIGNGAFSATLAYNLKSDKDIPKNQNTFEGDKDAMDEYVSHMLRMVVADELPFKSVEFAIPFFPTIRLKPETLRIHAHRQTILTALTQFLEHYESA